MRKILELLKYNKLRYKHSSTDKGRLLMSCYLVTNKWGNPKIASIYCVNECKYFIKHNIKNNTIICESERYGNSK